VCRPVRSKEEAMKPGSGAPPAMTIRGSNHLDGCRPGSHWQVHLRVHRPPQQALAGELLAGESVCEREPLERVCVCQRDAHRGETQGREMLLV
jgi:hypothetical protein